MPTLPDELSVETDGALRIVTLNRPEAKNATNPALHRALSEVWQLLADDEEASAVVLTGAGDAFSAGGDFAFMQLLQSSSDKRERVMEEARRILLEMIRFPLPIVAAVNGPAVGLGCSLAVSCDIVLISDRAMMSDPHVNVGLVAGDGGAALWPLCTSILRAKEFLFTGDAISPEQAVALGLANRIVAHDALLTEALELGRKLAAKPRKALRETKRALNMHIEQAARAPLEIAIQAEISSMTSDEHIAFVEQAVRRAAERQNTRKD